MSTTRWRLTRRTGAMVVMLTLALFVTGFSWAFSSPVGSSPDDDFHLSSIWCSRTAPEDACEVMGPNVDHNKRDVLVPTPVSEPLTTCFALDGLESAECVRQQTLDSEGVAPARANAGGYPGGFYDLLGLLVSDRPAVSVLVMRMATWLASIGIIVAALACSRQLWRCRYVLALVVTSVPLMIFLLTSVNPSAPTIAGTVAYAIAATALLDTSVRSRAIAATVVAIAAAIFALVSRPDAGIWLMVASSVISVLYLRHDVWRRPAIVLPAAVAVVSGVVVLLSSATNLTSGLRTGIEPRPLSDVLFRNVTELPSLWVGSLGTWSIGWFDTPMPAVCWAAMIGAFSAVVFTGLRRMFRTKAFALGLGIAALTVFPLVVLAGDGSVVGEGVQPRYLLPILPVLVAVSLASDRPPGRALFTRLQLALIAAAVIVANGVALHTNLRRYVWGLAEDGFNLNSDNEWWWGKGPSPMAVWLLGTIAFAIVVVILMSFVSSCVHQERLTPETACEQDVARAP